MHHVLLGREPADVADHDVVGPEPEGRADLRPARTVGPEQAAVDPPGPEDQPLEPPELRDRRSSRWTGRRSRASGCGTTASNAQAAPFAHPAGSGRNTGRSWCGSWRRPGFVAGARDATCSGRASSRWRRGSGPAGRPRWPGGPTRKAASASSPPDRTAGATTGPVGGRRRPEACRNPDARPGPCRPTAPCGRRAGRGVRETPLTCGANVSVTRVSRIGGTSAAMAPDRDDADRVCTRPDPPGS